MQDITNTLTQIYSMFHDALPQLTKGATTTLELTAVAVIAGALLGGLLCLMRISKNKTLNIIAKGYVNTMRSIPLVMVLICLYLIVPQFFRDKLHIYTDLSLPSALLAFSVFEAAYFCEILRSGVNAIPKNQFTAATALGFTPLQTFFHITVPQAFKNALPAFLTQCVTIFQDTSLVYIVGLTDFLGTTVTVGERNNHIQVAVLFSGFIYLIICVASQRIINNIKVKGDKK
ncbi:polar amino acid ABC transporter inner membrane subunit [Caballeronia peredens]|nr:polar amino acid ABC transporter inner membrane subunit [Caballeronia peredens]